MTDLILSENNLPANLNDLSKFVLIGNDKLQAVRAEISAIKKLGLAKEVHEQKLAEGQEIAEMVTLAKIKMGELLNDLPKASGGNRGNQYTNGKIASPVDFGKKENPDEKIEIEEKNICDEKIEVEEPKVKPKSEVIKEIGFTQKQAEQLQQMAKNPEVVHAAMAKARENDDIVSQSSVMKEIQETKRKEKANKQEIRRVENSAKIEKLATPLEAQGLFQTIVIDPPWDWEDEGDFNQFGRAKPEYKTMPFEEIKNLPIEKIADENCHLYLWVTNRSLPKAFELVNAWNFRYITCLTWVKPSIGMGNYFRGNTEQIIFAVKGSQSLKRHDVGTSFSAPRGKFHSEKPDEFYKLVESCSYAPFIDIFGRKIRENWTVWGENS